MLWWQIKDVFEYMGGPSYQQEITSTIFHYVIKAQWARSNFIRNWEDQNRFMLFHWEEVICYGCLLQQKIIKFTKRYSIKAMWHGINNKKRSLPVRQLNRQFHMNIKQAISFSFNALDHPPRWQSNPTNESSDEIWYESQVWSDEGNQTVTLLNDWEKATEQENITELKIV